MLSRDDKILERFLTESRLHLASVENDLLELEQQGDNIDYELVNCVFRAIHAVKGGAFFFGLENLGDLSHHLEVVLDRIRRGELTLTADIISLMLSGAEQLNLMLDNVDNIDAFDVSDIDRSIEELLFVTFSEEEKVESNSFVDIKFPSGKKIFTVNKYDFLRAAETEKGGGNVYLLTYDLIQDLEQKDKTPWEVISELLQICVFIDSKVDIESIGTLESDLPTSIPFYVLISTVIEQHLLCDFISIDSRNVFHVRKDGIIENIHQENGTELVESIMDYFLPDLSSQSETVGARGYELSDSSFELLKKHTAILNKLGRMLKTSCNCASRDMIIQLNAEINGLIGELSRVEEVNKSTGTSREQEKNNKDDIIERLSLIVFKNGVSFLALPLLLVDRLEKISADKLQSVVNGVLSYKEKDIELILSSQLCAAAALIESDEYIVAVIRGPSRDFGVVFNSIFTISNASSVIYPADKEHKNIIGTVVLSDCRIWLLDLHSFILSYAAERAVDMTSINADVKCVLLLDNSEFFLKYIRKVLQQYGLIVYIAKNKEEVYETLEEYGDDIGLILCGLNFPEKNILNFVQGLKDKKPYSEIRIIGLTTLVGEEKKFARLDKSRLIGEYIPKLDFCTIISECYTAVSEI